MFTCRTADPFTESHLEQRTPPHTIRGIMQHTMAAIAQDDDEPAGLEPGSPAAATAGNAPWQHANLTSILRLIAGSVACLHVKHKRIKW